LRMFRGKETADHRAPNVRTVYTHTRKYLIALRFVVKRTLASFHCLLGAVPEETRRGHARGAKQTSWPTRAAQLRRADDGGDLPHGSGANGPRRQTPAV
jgi:hypothetical protein